MTARKRETDISKEGMRQGLQQIKDRTQSVFSCLLIILAICLLACLSSKQYAKCIAQLSLL